MAGQIFGLGRSVADPRRAALDCAVPWSTGAGAYQTGFHPDLRDAVDRPVADQIAVDHFVNDRIAAGHSEVRRLGTCHIEGDRIGACHIEAGRMEVGFVEVGRIGVGQSEGRVAVRHLVPDLGAVHLIDSPPIDSLPIGDPPIRSAETEAVAHRIGFLRCGCSRCLHPADADPGSEAPPNSVLGTEAREKTVVEDAAHVLLALAKSGSADAALAELDQSVVIQNA